MNRDRSRNKRPRCRASRYATSLFWLSACRQYSRFIRWIVAANMANLELLCRGLSGVSSGKGQVGKLVHGGS